MRPDSVGLREAPDPTVLEGLGTLVIWLGVGWGSAARKKRSLGRKGSEVAPKQASWWRLQDQGPLVWGPL